jgi:hypothetical protein
MWNESNYFVCGELMMLFGINKLWVMVVWEPTLGIEEDLIGVL